jgi:hypothetical protein
VVRSGSSVPLPNTSSGAGRPSWAKSFSVSSRFQLGLCQHRVHFDEQRSPLLHYVAAQSANLFIKASLHIFGGSRLRILLFMFSFLVTGRGRSSEQLLRTKRSSAHSWRVGRRRRNRRKRHRGESIECRGQQGRFRGGFIPYL